MSMFTQDELVFLRKLAVNLFGTPLAPTDSSKDAILTRQSNLNGAGYVPSDPGFYTDLAAYAKQLNFDPIAMLIIIASESNFNTATIAAPIIATAATSFDKSLVGHDVAPRGLIGFTAVNVPSLLSVKEWDAMPTLSAREQLVYVMRAMVSNLARVGGRPFSSSYELYLANASPASMTQSGRYDLTGTMYSGNDWLDNLGMDHGPPVDPKGVPQGDTAYTYAGKHGQTALLPPGATRTQKAAYAAPLVQQGVIKGRVTLGDLQKHSERMNEPGWNLAWQLAAKRYAEANAPPVEKATYVEEDPAPFPSFDAPTSIPEEGFSWERKPSEPITKAPSGALVYPSPRNVLMAVGVLAVISTALGLTYVHLQR